MLLLAKMKINIVETFQGFSTSLFHLMWLFSWFYVKGLQAESMLSCLYRVVLTLEHGGATDTQRDGLCSFLIKTFKEQFFLYIKSSYMYSFNLLCTHTFRFFKKMLDTSIVFKDCVKNDWYIITITRWRC